MQKIRCPLADKLNSTRLIQGGHDPLGRLIANLSIITACKKSQETIDMFIVSNVYLSING